MKPAIIPMTKALDFAELSYERITIKIGEVECYCAMYDDYQIVAPRGTETKLISEGGWLDILADLAAYPWYHPHIGWGHYGAMAGAKSLVKHGLKGYLRKELPIILIGHSLGGAYALNAALLLAEMGFFIKGVITFGCLKSLYSDSALDNFRLHNINVWQYVNPGDPIADIPSIGKHVRKIYTQRPADGYSISNNHPLIFYRDALG